MSVQPNSPVRHGPMDGMVGMFAANLVLGVEKFGDHGPPGGRKAFHSISNVLSKKMFFSYCVK